MTSTPSDELKACPFCESEARLSMPDYPLIADCEDIGVRCVECDAVGPLVLIDMDSHSAADWPRLRQMAIAAWNRRPTSSRRSVLEEAARVANIMGVAASRIGARVEAILERDGSVEKAITGPGVGIGYLLAKELHSALVRGEATIRALAEED